MTKFVWLIGILIGIVLVSGCVGQQDLTPLVKGIPQFQEFLKDHPNADVRIVKLSEDYVSKNIASIKAECGEQIEVKAYYKATITENNDMAVAYLDVDTQDLICFYRGGTKVTTTSKQGSDFLSPIVPLELAPSNQKSQTTDTSPKQILEPATYGFEDYPSPFITGGEWTGMIVVGNDAPSSDIIGATDIAATLAQSVAIALGTSGTTSESTATSNGLFMSVDDSIVVNGKTVKLLDVSSTTTSATVDVDGVQQTITGTQSVNGLQIEVKSVSYSNIKAERSATLIIDGASESSVNAVVVQQVSGIPVATLDKDLTDAQKKKNLIIIGGSDVNRLTAEIAGVKYPASSNCDGVLDCAAGAAIMMLYKNPFDNSKTILIINGDTAVSRRYATNVLKDYTTYHSELKGTSVIVSSENGVLKVGTNEVYVIPL